MCCKKDSPSYRDKILEKWEVEWYGGKLPDPGENEDFFVLLLSEVYKEAKNKVTNNRRRNSRFKFLFLFVHILMFLFCVLTCIVMTFSRKRIAWLSSVEWSLAIALSFIGVCIILAIWLSAVISKWIDIKKYQETWGRHSTHVQRMENEMLTFYYGFSPYDVPDRKDIFIKNMQKIWAGNQDKFRDNIENKEKELMDTAQHLKSFVKF